MTTESQKVFEELYQKEYFSLADWQANPQLESILKAYMLDAWQASEARIRAMLGSEEMIKKITNAVSNIINDGSSYCVIDRRRASAALKAIVEGI